ncbi:hypothetical protein PRCB_18065 [Pantoea rodasii]|uniref:Uncharacterized protein n=1 Tax=Pantoea rodasii TaxID=1076549 RepID=A0A2M9W9F4_9GAMM|nr:hypothetical protein HA45_12125 [Pantoea rodasii]PJZ04173.1 hypothetical protein PRCB_18065 [Pantoea rodasii]
MSGNREYLRCRVISTAHLSAEDNTLSYIQLSLCGIAAEVMTGNALTLERRRTLYTPLHYTARWAAKLGSAEQRAA